MDYLSKKGVVTVFLAVILPVILSMCILLTDLYLIKTGRALIESGVAASAYSILGDYSTYLKENYDIYSFCMNEQIALNTISKNLEVNLGYSSFYDFRIENIRVEYSGGLLEEGVFLRLIKEAAPEAVYQSLVDEFLERFDIMGGISDSADIIRMKMNFDEAVKCLRENWENLGKAINGGEGIEYYVNLIGEDNGLLAGISELTGYIQELKTVMDDISAIKAQIENKITETPGSLNLLEEAAGALREEIILLYTGEIEKILKGVQKANEEAIDSIEIIFRENININFLSGQIKDKIENSANCPEYLKEILTACADVVKDIEDSFTEILFEEVKTKLNENIFNISNMKNMMENILDSDSIAQDFNEADYDMSKNYNTGISLVFTEDFKPGQEEDRRGFFEKLGLRILEKTMGEDIKIDENMLLPSGMVKSSGSEFNVTSTGDSTDSAENGISEFSWSIKSIGLEIIEELLINEYLLQHFSHETTGGNEDGNNGFLSNEVEYILWGSKSQNANVFYTKAALMGARFALNTIHVYSDSQKKLKADAIAAVTAGWWTMGAGIPVISNLIMCSWSIAESGIDVGNLCDGELVAVFKRKSDWITDIGISDAGIKSPDFLCMDYEDYIRIFLMMVPDDVKVLRMLDVICLNSPGTFNIFEAYTEVKVTATISFRSLTGGRHEEIITIQQSY